MDWSDRWKYFEPERRLPNINVETIDLLGFGSHRNVSQDDLTLAAQADHVVERLTRLSDMPAWLLGHSMGGAVVMLAADRRPDLIAGIINVEGNFTFRDAFWSSRIIRLAPDAWAERYASLRTKLGEWLVQLGIEPNDQRER